MLLPLNDTVVSRCLLLYGEWAFAEMALLAPFLRAGDVVIDCGAHVGTHTLFFARRVGPQGRVLSFEPQRLLYQHLSGNIALNGLGNVIASWAALGEKPGMIRPPEIAPSQAANLGGTPVEGAALPGPMQVPVSSIDGFNLPACRLIKIDTEGMERAVVLGAAQTIRRHRPLLYVENNDRQRSGALIACIADLGYRLYWHFSPYFRPGNPNKRAENVFPNTADPNMLCVPVEVEAALPPLDPVQGADDDWVKAKQRVIERIKANKKV
jgi:FkbM family methyltransferase